jgi:hypothetical protein
MTYTKGPWTIFTDLPEEHDGYIDHGGYRIDADGVEQIAYVWERSARINPATGEQDFSLPFGSADGEANARLISAAPDMYEALDRLMRIIASDDPWDREHVDDMNEACDAARSALLKAKGEA